MKLVCVWVLLASDSGYSSTTLSMCIYSSIVFFFVFWRIAVMYLFIEVFRMWVCVDWPSATVCRAPYIQYSLIHKLTIIAGVVVAQSKLYPYSVQYFRAPRTHTHTHFTPLRLISDCGSLSCARSLSILKNFYCRNSIMCEFDWYNVKSTTQHNANNGIKSTRNCCHKTETEAHTTRNCIV